jgi:dihydrolipoamide dehydrogenase
MTHRDVGVAILGAGTAGLHALSEVRRETDDFVVIDGGPLGTMCARIGCMPSKVLVQVADDFHRRHALEEEGIAGGEGLALDVGKAMGHVRALRDRFVSAVMENVIDPLADKLIRDHAEFLEPDLLQAGDQRIRARKVVIATGSTPTIPRPWQRFQDRILTTDTIFEQTELPEKMAVLGLGAVGLELGQALSRMGVDVTGFDALPRIGGLGDPEINRLAVELVSRDFTMHLGAAAEIEEDGRLLRVTANGESAIVDKLLVSVGRTPNLEHLKLDRLGIDLDDRGMPPFDRETMQVADLPIFIAGDVDGDRAVLHEASHEGRVAGYNAVREPPVRFRRRTRLGIAFCDPNICTVGETWDGLGDGNVALGEARFDSGRALIMLREEGLIRVYADKCSGTLLGAAMVAPRGEHLAHLLAWSIQRRMTVWDLLEMPFYHPVIEEILQGALTDLAGKLEVETDFPLGFASV